MTTRALLRPIGSPTPLGLAALAGASLVTSGSDLGWIATAESKQIAFVLLAFAFPLQLLASIVAFLMSDAVVATTLGVLACTWLCDGLIHLSSPFGARSGALGLLLLVTFAAVAAGSSAAASAKLVFAIASVRFALLGLYNLGASTGWEEAAGAVGLAVVAAAAYGARRQP